MRQHQEACGHRRTNSKVVIESLLVQRRWLQKKRKFNTQLLKTQSFLAAHLLCVRCLRVRCVQQPGAFFCVLTGTYPPPCVAAAVTSLGPDVTP